MPSAERVNPYISREPVGRRGSSPCVALVAVEERARGAARWRARLQGCWAGLGDALRTQAATCRAIFCGLENVKPPVVKKRSHLAVGVNDDAVSS